MRGCCCNEPPPPPPPEPCPDFGKTGTLSDLSGYPLGGVEGLFRFNLALTTGVVDVTLQFDGITEELGLVGPNAPQQWEFCLPAGVAQVIVILEDVPFANDRPAWSYSGACTGQPCIDPIDNNPLP